MTPHVSAAASPTATTEVLSPIPTAGVALPPISPDPALFEPATVVHVVDGDTIDVDLNGVRERVRYYGIDTPERGQHCFKEATARNTELIDGTVLLLPDARERDRYGRLLRYVFDGAGRSVDELLIAEGFAHAWQQDGAYRDMLVLLEGDAHAQEVGCLWSP